MSVSKSENVARQILLDLHTSGYEDFILVADTHQAFIKGPVAKPAKGKTVRRSVIMALAPGFYVGRLNDRVALRREHTDAAQGAAVLIKGDDGFPEPLISHSLLKIVFSPALPILDFRLRHLQQGLTVFVRVVIDLALLFYQGSDLRDKVCVDQDSPQPLPRLGIAKVSEELVVHLSADIHLPETRHGLHVVFDIRIVAGFGYSLPETIRL